MTRTSFRATCGRRRGVADCRRVADGDEREHLGAHLPGRVVVGIGMGLCNTTFIVACQAEVGWGDRGGAVSSNLFLRSIGMAIGAGIGGAVINFAIARVAPARATRCGSYSRRRHARPRPGCRRPPRSRPSARALQDVYLTAAVAAALALIFSLRLCRRAVAQHSAKAGMKGPDAPGPFNRTADYFSDCSRAVSACRRAADRRALRRWHHGATMMPAVATVVCRCLLRGVVSAGEGDEQDHGNKYRRSNPTPCRIVMRVRQILAPVVTM